jgi:predicted TPR repeat methyltransferase/thioredoxin-like negative regulator of GroEL
MDTIHVTADADALRNRAAELIEAGHFGAARPVLAAAQALAPQSPAIALISARLAMNTDAWDEAMRHLDTAIAASPAHGGLRKCRAEVRQKLGEREGAARDAAEAVICDPADIQAKAILGATMLDLGCLADGIACLTEAVAAAPEEVGYRAALADALEKCGDPDAALKMLLHGIELCDHSVSLRNAAIILCIRRRDFTQAVKLAEQARIMGIADASTFGMYGHALCSLGQHEDAAIAYQDALKLDPDDPHVRHLAATSMSLPHLELDPETHIRAIFDLYADSFENHLIALHYGIPAAIRAALASHPKIAAGLSLGRVLDLGCGTGLVALAIGDLPLESLTGIDLSPRMLAHAKAKRLYVELREANIIADLTTQTQHWPLIVAGDVVSYFSALETLLGLVHQRLEPGGWFVFSVEQILPDHDGVIPGNGHWSFQRQGRYAHSEQYIYDVACAAGFRILRMDHPVIRQEAGADVPGLLFVIERLRHDG